ncbi:MAG: SMC-Scp complex subunit ScpB, partial [Actinomycetota bacterium]
MQDRLEPPSVENLTEARRAIEAMLLVSNDPTPVQLLAQLVELPVDLVQSMCRELAGEYEEQRRGFQLAEVAGGWRFQTHPDTHAYVERFALEGMPNRLSSAALETLAIVAYKQPISRAQIGAIRGVNVDGVLRTQVQRGYVDEKGRDDGPGQATLFGTTPFFLEQLGLMSVDDLPPLGDFVPSVEVLEALENTLRVDPEPEPEIVIVDDDGEPITAESAPPEIPSTNGHGPESHYGATAEADADAPADEIDGQADVDDTEGAEDAVEGIEPATEVADDEDGAEPEIIDDEAIADDDDGEPAPEQDDAVDSTNGSSAESSNGSMVATNGHVDDEPVFEVLSDPAASIIALDTHLASSLAEAEDDASFDDSDFDDRPDEVEVAVEAEAAGRRDSVGGITG